MLEAILQAIGWALAGMCAGAAILGIHLATHRRVKVWRGLGHTLYRCPQCRIYAPWTHGIDDYQCQICDTTSPLPATITRRAGERQAKP